MLDNRVSSERTDELIIERDVGLFDRLFADQNVIDQKIANNMLKLNILFYFFVLVLISFLLFYGKHIFGLSNDGEEMNFSFYDFTLVSYNYSISNITNKYTCMKNTTSCENTCNDISIENLKKIFDIDCSYFTRYALAGEIVNFINKK